MCTYYLQNIFFNTFFILVHKYILRHWVLFVTDMCCQKGHPNTWEQEQLSYIFCGTCTSCHFLWKNDKGTNAAVDDSEGLSVNEWRSCLFSAVTSVCAVRAAQLSKADIKTDINLWLWSFPESCSQSLSGEGRSELFHVFGEAGLMLLMSTCIFLQVHLINALFQNAFILLAPQSPREG